MSNKMVVQCASFKGKQVVRAPIEHGKRTGKTHRDHTSGSWARRPQNIRDRQDRYDELK